MAEIKLKGIPGIITIVVIGVIAIFGSGLTSDTDFTNDQKLRTQLDYRLSSLEFGDIFDGVSDMFKKGIKASATKTAEKQRHNKIEVVAITGRKSILTFGSDPEYTLRVIYRVSNENEGTEDTRTSYYRSRNSIISDSWSTPEISTERAFSKSLFF
jgi:hypothetical protein